MVAISTPNASATDIAIIGMAGRFPGAPDLAAFARNLAAGVESISFFSDQEVIEAGVNPALVQNPRYVKAAAMLDGMELFDAEFFGLTPTEAALMDPQQRLFLECAWEALESAGYDPHCFDGAIGVYGGSNSNDYLTRARGNPELFEMLGGFFAQLANDKDYLTTRVSYKLNLTGPSIVVQTACSTSLVAVHLACQSVLAGECDIALAGGAGISKLSRTGYFYEPGGIHSPDGHCRAFDARAQGTVSGCGVGIVVLKRLGRAIEDGDVIRAVIKGSAINNDGFLKASFTAPSVDGQAKVIDEALAVGGVSPDTLQYVEAHGTGTPLGDPIEVAALTKVFRASTSRKGFCALGSVKASIGHLTAAAGVAGLIKTVLALERSTIPPSSYFEAPNPELDLANSPFYVPTTSEPWSANGSPRRAGVSSLGIGGTNAHVVIEEAPARSPSDRSAPWHLLVWSAKNSDALGAMLRRFHAFLAETPWVNLADAAYTLRVGRARFDHRAFMVCADTRAAVADLESVDSGRVRTGVGGPEPPSVIFLFPGGGVQYVGMAAELYTHVRSFRQDLDQCVEILRSLVDFDLREILGFSGRRASADSPSIDSALVAHAALVAVECCLARLWMRWGIEPSGVIGHSMGEYAAAAIAGVFTLEGVMRVVVARGRLMERVPAGIMLVVPLSEQDVQPFLNGRVSLAAVNAPTSCVISGFPDALEAVEAQLTQHAIDCRRLKFSHASHSPMMDPVLAEFAAEVARVRPQPPRIPLISNVTGTWITPGEASDPEYWSRHLRQTVRFSDGLSRVLADSSRLLIETGPGRTIEKLVKRQGLQFVGRQVLASLSAPDEALPDLRALLTSLGECWLRGLPVNWAAFHAGEKRQRVEMPTYAFQRKRYWVDAPALPRGAAVVPGAAPGSNRGLPAIRELRRSTSMSTESASSGRPAASSAPVPRPAAPRGAAIETELTETVARLFGYDGHDFDRTAAFVELGADSLLLMRLSRKLEDRFGVTVPFRLLMTTYSSIERLAGHLAPLVAGSVDDARIDTASSAHVPEPPAQQTPAVPSVLGAGAERLPAVTGVSHSELSDVVKEQLRIMASQLALLGQSAGSETRAPSALAAPPIEVGAPRPELTTESPSDAGSFDEPSHESEKPVLQAAAFGPFKPIEPPSVRPMTPPQAEHLARLVETYTARTRSSKQSAERYRPFLADPRSAAGFQFAWKDLIYPIVGTRSRGSRIWDADGHEYVDYTMGFGVHLFGHSPGFLMEALTAQLAAGIHIGPQSDLAGTVAELITEATGMERVAFCNSGTEAVMGALRLARAATGRRKVVMFAGSYHGTFDGVLARSRAVNGRREAVPVSPGTPPNMLADLIVLDYGTEESLAAIAAHASDLAAVIVEPVQSRNLDLQPREFLHALRRITASANIALIFDEIIWGFRLHPAGAQGWFGVNADLAAYGKVLGGGLPIGVIAGAAKYLDAVDGGRWSYGDESWPVSPQIVFAGTFSKNPLAMAAARAILRRLNELGPGLQENLNARTRELAARLRDVFQEHGVPMKVASFGSMFRFARPPAAKYLDLLLYHALRRGVYIWEGRGCFLSTAHTAEDLDALVRAIREGLEDLRSSGLVAAPAVAGSPTAAAEPPGVPSPIAGPSGTRQILQLTAPLRHVFVHAHLSTNSSLAYNELLALRIDGDLNLSALNAAVRKLVARHEALRTTFDANGEYLTIAPDLAYEIAASERCGDEARSPGAVARLLDENLAEPFDLARGPLFRIRLYRTSPHEHLLVLVFHHLIMDGFSVEVFVRELGRFYSGEVTDRPYVAPETVRFGDYVLRQLEQEGSAEAARARASVLARVAGAPAARLRGERDDSSGDVTAGSRESAVLPESISEGVKRQSPQYGCTPLHYYLAAFLLLLHRWTDQKDLLVGIPSLRRTFRDDEHTLAHSVDVLPIRSSIVGDPSAAAFIETVRDEVLRAQEDSAIGYSQLSLEAKAGGEQPPLISVTFNLDPGRRGERASSVLFSGLTTSRVPHGIRRAKFDLHWNLSPAAKGVRLGCDYRTHRCSPEVVRTMVSAYRQVLEALLANAQRPLSSIPLLDETARAAVLRDLNNPLDVAASAACVHDLFSETAHCEGTRTALTASGQTLTYRELDDRSTQLARFLVGRGVLPEDRVGLCMQPGLDAVVAMLGILKAGGAYVPLDPTYPVDRLAYITSDSKISLFLTQDRLRTRVEELGAAAAVSIDSEWPAIAIAGDVLPATVAPDNAAYVTYTSGSTGRPKGVVATHRAVVRLVRRPTYVDLNAARTLLKTAPMAFDASTFEVWGALLNGAKLVVYEGAPGDLHALTQTMAAHRVDTVWLTTPLFHAMARDALDGFEGVEQVLTGGDVLSSMEVRRFLDRWPDCALINFYGPTEATTFTTSHRVTCDDCTRTSVPVGRPIANTLTFVLDAHLQPQPPGVPGELFIGGPGLARGYLNRPDLTADRFAPDPFAANAGARLYRTGDVVRWLSDGTLEFLGRFDEQVKIRGFRVEPAEIEAALTHCEGVREAAVVVSEVEPGDKRLVAYLTATGRGIDVGALRAELKGKLPAYMRPSALLVLDRLPVSPSGKLDRRALPDPGALEPVAADYAPPTTAIEQRLAEIWAGVLAVPRVGIHDDFFDLGGDSLRAFRVVTRIHDALGVRVEIATLFDNPSIARLSAEINALIAAQPQAALS